jgi:hypothetical protein
MCEGERREEREIARVESRERESEWERERGKACGEKQPGKEREGERGKEGGMSRRERWRPCRAWGRIHVLIHFGGDFVPSNVSRRRYLSSEGGRAFGGVEGLAQMPPESVNQSKGSKGECADTKEAFSDKRARRQGGESKGKKGNEEKRGRRESDA